MCEVHGYIHKSASVLYYLKKDQNCSIFLMLHESKALEV